MNEKYFSVLAMCTFCFQKWFASVLPETSLFKLECPKCHRQNSFASFIPDEYLKEWNEKKELMQ